MGRQYTGADYTTNAYQLDVFHLRRSGVIVPGKTVRATMSWSSGPTVELESTWTEQQRTLFLKFRLEEEREEPITWTQRITLQTMPSSLGQGEVLYFTCPRSGKRCRKIYRAYHSHGFYHRGAFNRPLFYPAQASSWMKRPDRQLQAVERNLERLKAKRTTSSYLGKPTRRALRTARLQEEALRLEELRWSDQYTPKAVLNLVRRFL